MLCINYFTVCVSLMCMSLSVCVCLSVCVSLFDSHSVPVHVSPVCAEAKEIIETASSWDKPGTALVISMIGGVFFIYRVYLQIKLTKLELKKLSKEIGNK